MNSEGFTTIPSNWIHLLCILVKSFQVIRLIIDDVDFARIELD